jgi:hypothetical protein
MHKSRQRVKNAAYDGQRTALKRMALSSDYYRIGEIPGDG